MKKGAIKVEVVEIEIDLSNYPYKGAVKLFKVSPPVHDDEVGEVEYIISSGINNSFGRETFLFRSDEKGQVLSYTELPGSFTGGVNHDKAIDGFIKHYGAIH